MLRERHSASLIIIGILIVFWWHAAAYAQESVAIVKVHDGNEIALNNVLTSHIDVPLKGGVLSIPIRLLAGIKSTDIKNKYQINLVSGESYERIFKEKFKGEKLEGEMEVGLFSIPFREIETITFRHKEISQWSQPDGFVAQINGVKVYGLKYRFRSFGPVFTFPYNYFQYLSVADGAVLYRIPFSKIKEVKSDGILFTDGARLVASMYLKDKAIYQGDEWKLVFDTHGLEKELYGEIPHGNIVFSVEQITSFLFLHDLDKISPKVEKQLAKEQETFEFSNNLSSVLVPVYGSPIAVDQLHVISIWSSGGYLYKYEKSPKFNAKIGEMMVNIELSRVNSIKDFRVNERYASGDPINLMTNVITRSGKIYPVGIYIGGWDKYFGGKCIFGYVRVHPAFLKEVKIK